MTKYAVLTLVAILFVVAVVMTSKRETAPVDGGPEASYVRDEDDSVKAFYEPYAKFTPETPASTAAFVSRLEVLTGLPRRAETYPTDIESLGGGARSFAAAAEELFGFDLAVDDPDSTQLDRFANAYLVDENVRGFFEGDQLRSDLTVAEAERYDAAVEALTLPNEPLLYYAMGAFWGEWLVTHRGARWALYDPLRPIQSFPDMLSVDLTVCMHPFSQVVKKFTDPAGDQLSFKAQVFTSMKKYFAPYPLTASISDAELASRAWLPREAVDAIALEENGRTDEAFRSYRAAIAREPNNARVYAMGVSVAWQLERWAEVEAWLVEGLRLAPDNPVLNHNLAAFYAGAEGGLEPAIELLERALEIDPRYARAHITIASCLRDKGRMDEAIEHVNWVLDNDPELAEDAKALLASFEE